MQFAIAAVAIFLTNIPYINADANANVPSNANASVCENPKEVDIFASAFYTAMIVAHDPNIVNFLTITGGQAGMIAYNEVKKVLEQNRACYAEEDAFTAGRALALAGQVTLPIYFNKAAYTSASSLYQLNRLNCTNAVELALRYFGYVQQEMMGLDENEFKSYIHGIVFGWLDMIMSLGLTTHDVKNIVVDKFYKSFEEDKTIKKSVGDTQCRKLSRKK